MGRAASRSAFSPDGFSGRGREVAIEYPQGYGLSPSVLKFGAAEWKHSPLTVGNMVTGGERPARRLYAVSWMNLRLETNAGGGA